MCFSFLLLGCFLLERISGLEPGKDKQDFESIEEVKSHEDSSQTEEEPEDVTWVPEAVLDVAYYLRKHKYNGYDPRYLMETGVVHRNLYAKFPRPPVKALHWEVGGRRQNVPGRANDLKNALHQVKKNCEPSFISCLRYLQGRVTQTELPRHLDSLTIIRHNGWTMDRDEDLIKATDAACSELRDRDEMTFNVFSSPLQKFQWLVTASYYMCWYTMKEVSHLKTFNEACDNYANCLDPETGTSNGDYRADDGQPFACALYSFCPDPCCQEKRVTSRNACAGSNPCGRHMPKNQTCFFDRRKNVDLDSIVLNYWNVSCNCDAAGMRWESRSGMCVDVDECIEYSMTCELPSESCMNLPGSYRCVCNMMGYTEDGSGRCVPDAIIQKVIHPPKIPRHRRNKTVADTFFDFVYRMKYILSGSDEAEKGERPVAYSGMESEN